MLIHYAITGGGPASGRPPCCHNAVFFNWTPLGATQQSMSSQCSIAGQVSPWHPTCRPSGTYRARALRPGQGGHQATSQGGTAHLHWGRRMLTEEQLLGFSWGGSDGRTLSNTCICLPSCLHSWLSSGLPSCLSSWLHFFLPHYLTIGATARNVQKNEAVRFTSFFIQTCPN